MKKDLIEGAIGFASAFALVGAVGMIVLGVLGFFDQGIAYKYPPCHPGTVNALFTSCERARQ